MLFRIISFGNLVILGLNDFNVNYYITWHNLFRVLDDQWCFQEINLLSKFLSLPLLSNPNNCLIVQGKDHLLNYCNNIQSIIYFIILFVIMASTIKSL